MSQFTMRVAFVGNPVSPTVPFDEAALTALQQDGFNTLQLNIAWGCRPGDEPLNLEDILDVDGAPDARQQKWFAEIARRACLAKAMGFRVLFHFGAPKMDSLYKMIASPQEIDRQTNLYSIQKEEIVAKYEKLLTQLATEIPEVDDILMYTFDQEAWLGDEFGNDPLAAGIPLAARVVPFLQRMTACWAELRPEGRLWWEPWEISAGTIYDTLPQLPKDNFGMMLHSNIAEVQMANPVDHWFRNMAALCEKRGIPVCGEVFLTGANEEVEPLQHAFAPSLVWDQIHRLQDLGIYGIKEYFGTRPDMPEDASMAMAAICFAQPMLSRREAMAHLAARWPDAPSLPAAFEAADRALSLFPWEFSWRWRTICGQHTSWHPYTRWLHSGNVASSPSWCSSRRAIFMTTAEETENHPWLIEDIGLRCRHAAEAMREASQYYAAASSEAGSTTLRAAADDFACFAAVAQDLWLHAEETLCAIHIRRLSQNGNTPKFLVERMTAAMQADVENQKEVRAVAPGSISEAPAQLAAFLKDPAGYCAVHFK